jgi:hypothetical protein
MNFSTTCYAHWRDLVLPHDQLERAKPFLVLVTLDPLWVYLDRYNWRVTLRV